MSISTLVPYNFYHLPPVTSYGMEEKTIPPDAIIEECIVCKEDKPVTRSWFICCSCKVIFCNQCETKLLNDECPHCRCTRNTSKEAQIPSLQCIAEEDNFIHSKLAYYKLAVLLKTTMFETFYASKKVLEYYEKAEAFYELGYYHNVRKINHPIAKEYYEKSIDIQEEDWKKSTCNLALIYLNEGNRERAIALYKTINIENSYYKYKHVYYMMAKVYYDEQDYDRALIMFNNLYRDNHEEKTHISKYLGIMHRNGWGTTRDSDKAFKFLIQAVGFKTRLKSRIMDLIEGKPLKK